MTSDLEKFGLLLTTCVSNLAGLPAIIVLVRQGLDFEAFLALSVIITSTMYHFCESLEVVVWINNGSWHRLDNIVTISVFMCFNIYLMDLADRRVHDACRFLALFVVLVLQEGAPWDERFTFGPIIASSLAFFFKRWLVDGCLPRVDMAKARIGSMLMIVAVACFIRGLDDRTDPVRIFHGMWHICAGIASYYLWQILISRNDPRGYKQVDPPTPSSSTNALSGFSSPLTLGSQLGKM